MENIIWNKLKKRWGISNNFQVAHILVVFAVTGFSTLFAHNYIDHLLGIEEDDSFWIKLVVFIVIVLPLFNTLLFFWGIVLGQRKFITAFIKLKLNLFFKIFRFKNKNF